MSTPPPDEAPRHEATLLRSTVVTANLRRLTFGGSGLHGFASSSLPDERVLVHFPTEPPHARSYTVRRYDPSAGELDIDFVLHGHGGAAQWATGARPGDRVRLSSASGWFRPPGEIDWLVLIADHAGLPAIGRILEQVPHNLEVRVVGHTADPRDRLRFTSKARVAYTWLPDADTLLTEVTTAALPAGIGYLWCAVEARTARRIRSHFRRTLSIPATHMHVMGYWREDKEEWERRYAAVSDRIDAAMGDAMIAGKDFEAVRDAVDDAMEREGL
ncbi:NADPH-dependent ferric siderophore reductase [Rhodococcus sp. 27YEA15]|uniref:siderophore-interacting protein n=1 Tax=Rhodococcus sp. 27YEA15 TaxID=3156259 RepID=UPI003C7CA557